MRPARSNQHRLAGLMLGVLAMVGLSGCAASAVGAPTATTVVSPSTGVVPTAAGTCAARPGLSSGDVFYECVADGADRPAVVSFPVDLLPGHLRLMGPDPDGLVMVDVTTAGGTVTYTVSGTQMDVPAVASVNGTGVHVSVRGDGRVWVRWVPDLA